MIFVHRLRPCTNLPGLESSMGWWSMQGFPIPSTLPRLRDRLYAGQAFQYAGFAVPGPGGYIGVRY